MSLFAYLRISPRSTSRALWETRFATLKARWDRSNADSYFRVEAGSFLYLRERRSHAFVSGTSLSLGNLCGFTAADFLGERPPGTAFSLHSLPDQVRLSLNIAGSYSIWYYHDEDIFLASTSQLTLVRMLGSFESNPQAVSWMLAAGNCGPGNSWDQRLHHLNSAEEIVLSDTDWVVLSRQNSYSYSNFAGDRSILEKSFSTLLNEVFDTFKIQPDSSVITLSGGFDSRMVLYLLTRRIRGMRTATWGLRSARDEINSDAYIAARLAMKCGVVNHYYETDFSEPRFRNWFDRFLEHGEGRIDHLNSFMDSFHMWEDLGIRGYDTVIRADEMFGWLPCSNTLDVRISLEFQQMEDNANMVPLREFGLQDQIYIERYSRLETESLEQYRDRLYRIFRLPMVLTGLHDLIRPYADVLNPLLDDRITKWTFQLPDSLRTGKVLAAEYAAGLFQDIPVARKPSIPEPSSILQYSRIVSFVLDELNSAEGRMLFSDDFRKWVVQSLNVNDDLINRTTTDRSLWLRSKIPWQLKKVLRRDLMKYKANFNQLAFRATIAIGMQRIMRRAAGELVSTTKEVGV